MTATMPTGTLTRNSQCQLKSVASQPPSVGPMAGATIAAMPQMASVRPCRSRGYSPSTMAMPTGSSAPPPKPWRTRKKTSTPKVGARAQAAEAAVKAASDSEEHALAAEAIGQPPRQGLGRGRRPAGRP